MIRNPFLLKKSAAVLSSLLLAASLGSSAAAAAAPEIAWNKPIGPDNSSAVSVADAAYGEFVMAGSAKGTSGAEELLLLGVDQEGREKWARTYSYDGGNTIGAKVHPTKDGGRIVVGSTTHTVHGKLQEDIYLLKTDAHGDKQWESRLGGSVTEWGQDVAELPDGGYLVAGLLVNGNIPTRAGVLVRTDANGKELWTKTYGSDLNRNGSSGLQSILPLRDGTFLLCGQKGPSWFDLSSQAYVLNIDANGQVKWERTYGDKGKTTSANDIRPTADSGFIVTGQTAAAGRESNVYLLKLGADKEPEWQAEFGNNDHEKGNAVVQSPDGGYLIAGTRQSSEDGHSEAYFVRTDDKGNLTGEQTLSEANAGALLPLNQGAYLAAGSTIPFPGDSSKLGHAFLAMLKAPESKGEPEPSQDQLQGIVFDRSDYTLQPGEKTPVVVSAVYGSGRRVQLDAGVRFYSNKPAAASIGAGGLLTAGASGSTFLTAEYQGMTANAEVKVENPEAPRLVGLTAEPGRLALGPGEERALKLIARYADGSTRDVTSEADLYINDPRIGKLKLNGGKSVAAKEAGWTFLTAVYDDQSVVIELTVR